MGSLSTEHGAARRYTETASSEQLHNGKPDSRAPDWTLHTHRHTQTHTVTHIPTHIVHHSHNFIYKIETSILIVGLARYNHRRKEI